MRGQGIVATLLTPSVVPPQARAENQSCALSQEARDPGAVQLRSNTVVSCA
jgi:hypothetical protein